MAMAMLPGENSRFTDVYREPIDRLLSPIKGYENKPLVSLTEAITPIAGLFHEIEDYVFVALHNCRNPADGLTQEESAAIHLYTMQFHGGPSLYLSLNQSLRDENREELQPWFPFLKLFLTALYKLPSKSGIIWRGVKNVDLSSKYKTGSKIAWWGVSSCTAQIEVLESNIFLGKHGQRTIFSIECINGKSITNHSYFKNKEKELVLIPGSYFEVIGKLNPAHDLHIIQLQEITPPISLIKPPFLQISDVNPPYVANHRSYQYSQLSSSNMVRQNPNYEYYFKRTSSKSNLKWNQYGFIIPEENAYGNKLNQLSYPKGIFIDDDQNIYVADFLNHRIVKWKSNEKNCRVVAGGNGKGSQTDQLNSPTDVIIDTKNNSLIIADSKNKRVLEWFRGNNENGHIFISHINCVGLAMDKDGSLYVSDNVKNEVRRWKVADYYGTIIAGGNGKGDQLNQLHGPTYIFVDEDYSVYVSDSWNHRVMKWMKDAKEGILVAGGNDDGNTLAQLSNPQGVIVDRLGQIYVADWGNHRVMRWCKGAKEGTIVVGENREGQQSNQFFCPIGLSFDRNDNLYVVEESNHRIQKFEIDER